jgi:hypothetical protein
MKKLLLVIITIILSSSLLAACSSQKEPKPDKELYLEFYKNVMNRISAMDHRYQPFIKAVESHNILDAVVKAVEIKDPMGQLWLDFSNIKPPQLKDEKAFKELEEAKKLLDYAYLSRNEAMSNYIEYSKNPSIYVFASVKKNTEDFQQQMYLGLARLISAGYMLGLKGDEITGAKTVNTGSTPK